METADTNQEADAGSVAELRSASHRNRPLILPALLLGIGLSGFFDGILLHQVLQWHHLLSLVPGETYRDPKVQILADGLFHVLMYLVTVWGLSLLARRRTALGGRYSARDLVAGVLLGFGLWNVIDVAFFHWILGIHRIRVDAPDPLAWDIFWILTFGLAPLLAAVLAWKGWKGRKASVPALTIALLATAAAVVSAAPPRAGKTTLVLFSPSTQRGEAITAVVAHSRIIWADPDARMFAVILDRPDGSAALRRAGALIVTRSPLVAGCVAAAQAA